MKIIPTIIAILILVLIIIGSMVLAYRQETHAQAIKNVATFGEQHKYEDFMLKKGTCLRIKTEIGDVLICLPNNGRPELLIAPETTN